MLLHRARRHRLESVSAWVMLRYRERFLRRNDAFPSFPFNSPLFYAQETAFGGGEQPSLTEVEECMDLFRQAAELYSAADDKRHEQVSYTDVARYTTCGVGVFRA